MDKATKGEAFGIAYTMLNKHTDIKMEFTPDHKYIKDHRYSMEQLRELKKQLEIQSHSILWFAMSGFTKDKSLGGETRYTKEEIKEIC